ncbi:MAG: hypothetical protein ACI8X5_003239 [Planctomycetota bacterium]|jgi:hypothetical protein
MSLFLNSAYPVLSNNSIAAQNVPGSRLAAVFERPFGPWIQVMGAPFALGAHFPHPVGIPDSLSYAARR